MSIPLTNAPTRRAPNHNLMLLPKTRIFVARSLVLGYFSFATANFLSAASAVRVSKHVAINGSFAIGMTCIINGPIDLSGGSVVGLTRILAGSPLLYGVDFGPGRSIRFNTFEIILSVARLGVWGRDRLLIDGPAQRAAARKSNQAGARHCGSERVTGMKKPSEEGQFVAIAARLLTSERSSSPSGGLRAWACSRSCPHRPHRRPRGSKVQGQAAGAPSRARESAA